MVRRAERGHLMVGLVAAMAILAILSTAAFQAWEEIRRRDDEAEMIFRAEDIVYALHRFRKDQGRLPATLEELLEPGNRGQYFIRRLYEDPLVKNGKWGLLYTAPGGGILDPNAESMDAIEALGEISQSAAPADPVGGLRSQFGGGPREVQGMPIAGVKSLSTDMPFRVRRGISDYSMWLFTILDIQPQKPGGQAQRGGRATPGRPGVAPGGRRPRGQRANPPGGSRR